MTREAYTIESLDKRKRELDKRIVASGCYSESWKKRAKHSLSSVLSGKNADRSGKRNRHFPGADLQIGKGRNYKDS